LGNKRSALAGKNADLRGVLGANREKDVTVTAKQTAGLWEYVRCQ
jgi:hypothetical protein